MTTSRGTKSKDEHNQKKLQCHIS